MSWTDKASINHIKQIRDIFKIATFVETGSYKGVNLLAHRFTFKQLYGCEINPEWCQIARQRTGGYDNIDVFNMSSPNFLRHMPLLSHDNQIMYYLDAHFYNPKTKDKSNHDRFVVLQELESLVHRDKSILIIHDFDNNLGHITYDGISLDMNLLRESLTKVNPDFRYYTNELSSCDIVKSEEDIDEMELPWDKEMWNTLEFIHSKPEKTYRGILYCVPKPIKVDGLREIK